MYKEKSEHGTAVRHGGRGADYINFSSEKMGIFALLKNINFY